MHNRCKSLKSVLFGSLVIVLTEWGSAQTVSKASDLKLEPTVESKTVKTLAVSTPVKLSKRQGFWVEVEATGAKGWLKLSNISLTSDSSGAGIGVLETGRTGTGNIISTSAARGLSTQQLMEAKPDFKQFEALKDLNVSNTAAATFGAAAGLQSRTIAMLAAPTAPVASHGTAAAKAPTTKSVRKGSPKDDDDEDD